MVHCTCDHSWDVRDQSCRVMCCSGDGEDVCVTSGVTLPRDAAPLATLVTLETSTVRLWWVTTVADCLPAEMDLSCHKMTRVLWSGHQTHTDHLHSTLSMLQSSSCLVDATLVSGSGQSVRCHKIVLAAISNLLRKLFEENNEKVCGKINKVKYKILISPFV